MRACPVSSTSLQTMFIYTERFIGLKNESLARFQKFNPFILFLQFFFCVSEKKAKSPVMVIEL